MGPMQGAGNVPTPLPRDDRRATIPLFTAREAARYVRVPASTMRNWVRGYEYPIGRGAATSAPIVSSLPAERPSHATIPFIGLAEALVVAGFRRKKLSMHKVRSALEVLDRTLGIAHVLANKMLYTDGASILCDYARKAHDQEIQSLTEPSSGQTVFVDVVRQYLQLITYDADWWASRIELPAFHPTRVVVDMHRGFGRPILDGQRLAVDDILDRFYYGQDSIHDIATDLELDPNEVENVIRAAWRPAAAA
jgi:uncharacterized protein (DUF433 family)